MNTTKRGTELEIRVEEYLKKLVENDELPGTSSKRSKVFRQKQYVDSEGRKYNLDVTIETYLNQDFQDRGEWSQLMVFECKNYSHK